MLSVSRLLNGTIGPNDALRYGRMAKAGPSHLLHYSADKKPVVVWNVTQRCNLHCGHCYSNSFNREYPDELDTKQGEELLGDLDEFGVPVVLFSGGEPLLRSDLIHLLATAHGLGMRAVISTNGTLIDDAMAKSINSAGCDYVGVSLDGIGPAHDKIRGRHGAYDDALEGIAACKSEGLSTGIRFTIHGLNRSQLGDVFEVAERLGVNRLCVYHLAYAGRGERISQHDLSPAQTREAMEEVFDRTEDLHRRGVEMEVLTVDNPVDNVLLYMRVAEQYSERAADAMRMLKWNGGNQSGVAVACVDPRGNVHPDQFSWHISAGNVCERKFSEIWSDNDSPVLAPYRRRPRDLVGRCAGCRWYEICNGGLRVRAESATGDGRSSDPACYLTEDEILTQGPDGEGQAATQGTA